MAPSNTSLLHFLLSQPQDFTSLRLFLFLPRSLYEVKRWKRNSSVPGNFGQRTYSVELLSIPATLSYLGKTKAVVRDRPVLPALLLRELRYDNRGQAFLFYFAAVLFWLDVCGIKKMKGEQGCRNDLLTFIFQALSWENNHNLKTHLNDQHTVLKDEQHEHDMYFMGLEIKLDWK